MELLKNDSYYELHVNENEEIPLDVWAVLVRLRAEYRCQDCGKEQHYVDSSRRINLRAHHILPLEFGGITSLANGECLCTICHGKAHRRYNRERRLKQLQHPLLKRMLDRVGYSLTRSTKRKATGRTAKNISTTVISPFDNMRQELRRGT